MVEIAAKINIKNGNQEIPFLIFKGDTIDTHYNLHITDDTFAGITQIDENAMINIISAVNVSGNIIFPDLTYIKESGLNGCFSQWRDSSEEQTFNVGKVSFPELLEVEDYGLNSTFSSFQMPDTYRTNIGAIEFPKLHTVGKSGIRYCFNRADSLKVASFPELTTIDEYGMYWIFGKCADLEVVSLPKLTTCPKRGLSVAFQHCTSLEELHLDSLSSLTGIDACDGMCGGCTNLTSVTFPSLATITGRSCLEYAFSYCTKLQHVYFPALSSNCFTTYDNQFYGMLNEVTGCTVHFPSNLASKLSNISDIRSGMKGKNISVLYDLPAT